jgi:hypothetical protein
MDENKVKKWIFELAELSVQLEKKGGPARAGRLFEKFATKQDEILEECGLPSTPVYLGLLEFSSAPWDKDVEKLVELLKKEAAAYRAEYGDKPELEILIAAKVAKRDPMMVLPEIHVATHTYTIWVYNNILMHYADSTENVLDELMRTKDSDALDLIGRTETDPFADRKTVIADLESRGFRYVRQFFEESEQFIRQLLGDEK